MIMVMGTEGFSKAGNNNCDRTRERKRKRAREERERCGEGNSGSVGALEEEPGDDGRTDGRTNGRKGRKEVPHL
jgi:hypothetical protein